MVSTNFEQFYWKEGTGAEMYLNSQPPGPETGVFFTPIPCTHNSLPLDGRNYYYFIYMDTQDHAIYRVWIHFFLLPYTQGERRKTIWCELESNPGPLASQATTLTT